jgi:hypothetical protein
MITFGSKAFSFLLIAPCMLCLFQEYQTKSIEALFAEEVKKADVADAM